MNKLKKLNIKVLILILIASMVFLVPFVIIPLSRTTLRITNVTGDFDPLWLSEVIEFDVSNIGPRDIGKFGFAANFSEPLPHPSNPFTAHWVDGLRVGETKHIVWQINGFRQLWIWYRGEYWEIKLIRIDGKLGAEITLPVLF